MKLSIIVPVYNVEAYLPRCVDQILTQTFADFELILVDDGSPDGCPAMCDAYAKTDARVKVIHKKNGSQADARNVALDIAQGEYIGFVDSDDIVHPQMFELLMEIAKQTSADIVQCGHEKFSDVSQFHDEPNISAKDLSVTVLKTADVLKDFFPDHCYLFTSTVWDKIYKRHIFNDIRFPLGMYYEDAYIRLFTVEACSTIAITPIPLYHYFYRPGSTMNSSYSPKWFRSAFRNNQMQLDFFRKRGNSVQVGYALDDMLMRFCRDKMAVYCLYPQYKQDFRAVNVLFRKEFWPMMCCPQLCRMKKVLVITLLFFPKLAKRICDLYFPEFLHEFMREKKAAW